MNYLLQRIAFTGLCLFTFALVVAPTAVAVETVSFLVDPATIDNNPADGTINGNEFAPTGTDGTIFQLTPTNNLVGGDRFLLSPVNGLSFGGGSGSTLSFDFTTDKAIQLNDYTIGGGLSLNNPVFDIREGANVLSAGNAGDTSGGFVSGPISLDAGTTYSFVVTNIGAGVQRQLASWSYSVVPEPTTATLVLLGLLMGNARSRARNS